LAAQQGVFSVCENILADHADILNMMFSNAGDEVSSMFYQKILIPRGLKAEFRRQLQAANVTARSLFPGIDGLGRSVGEIVRMATMYVEPQPPGSFDGLYLNEFNHVPIKYIDNINSPESLAFIPKFTGYPDSSEQSEEMAYASSDPKQSPGEKETN
jgi:hypothetical protein